MKISKRRYKKKLAAVRWEALGQGQEHGRKEIADNVCNWIGQQRSKHANTPHHETLLFVQSFLEGQRLIAHLYDETEVEDVIDFQKRFIDFRRIMVEPKTFPNVSQDNYTKIKSDYPDKIIFFRKDENYSVYDVDAVFVMGLLGINTPYKLVTWSDRPVPVIQFTSVEVAIPIHEVTETGKAVVIAEPLLNAQYETLYVLKPQVDL